MTERPILFSGPMVRAILDGSKTQTRRVIKPEWSRCLDLEDDGDRAKAVAWCPYGAPGDRLCVREAFRLHVGRDGQSPTKALETAELPLLTQYEADGADLTEALWHPGRLRPSIHMPRALSRLTLEITDVRVERVQEITPADVFAEGVGEFVVSSPDVASEMFARLWDGINGPRGFGWEANPYVWVVGFKRVQP
ncbi:MAG TPA: hypothetical protein VF576_06455 [Rubricoccaceae bacterium]|jgi:hypothetical protein